MWKESEVPVKLLEKGRDKWRNLASSLLADSQRREVPGYERGSSFQLSQVAATLTYLRALPKCAGTLTLQLHKPLCCWWACNSEDTNMAAFSHTTRSSIEMQKSHMCLWEAELMPSDFPELSGWICWWFSKIQALKVLPAAKAPMTSLSDADSNVHYALSTSCSFSSSGFVSRVSFTCFSRPVVPSQPEFCLCHFCLQNTSQYLES